MLTELPREIDAPPDPDMQRLRVSTWTWPKALTACIAMICLTAIAIAWVLAYIAVNRP